MPECMKDFLLVSGRAVTYHFEHYNRLYIYIYIFRANNTAMQKVNTTQSIIKNTPNTYINNS